MKRQAPVPLEVVEHNGFFYATIDFVTPDKAFANMQTSWITLRPGWELVPHNEDIVNNVVKPHKWGGIAVVFENGDAYHTSIKSNGPPGPGALAGQHLLQKMGNQFKPSKFSGSGDLRVLVRTAATGSPSNQTHLDSICSRMWKRRRFTDYTVICAGEKIPCHRAVLAEASSVFDRALDSNMREAADGSFEIKDAAPHSVQSMLAFMYTGKLEDEPIERIADLMVLADRYGIEALVLACTTPLLASLNPDNAITVTRALKGFKHKPQFEAIWKDLQKKIKDNDELLSAVMDQT